MFCVRFFPFIGGVGMAPETSYSSSEGEDDFFDANDDTYTSQEKNFYRYVYVFLT